MKPSSSSTSSTESGERVVMLRAVALRLESGTMTWTSIPSISINARLRACMPSAPIPSSLVRRTRIASILGTGQGIQSRMPGIDSLDPEMTSTKEIWTVGHSTHEIERFVGLLRRHDVEVVCDVRRYPGSRRNPQFNEGALREPLTAEGLAYEPFGSELGGRRKPRAGGGP